VIEDVVKIGGRLGRGNNLRSLCEETARLARRHRLLVVPGGGVFADTVRRCDARVGLSDTAAHWMAILAMDQYGLLLTDLIPGSSAVRSLDDARACAAKGRTPVLLPFELTWTKDALPHAWDVTADSIAAWVAGLVDAGRLILVKDAKGMEAPMPGPAAVSPGPVSLDQLAEWEGVDRFLAHILEGSNLDLWIIDGERPERLREVFQTGRTDGILLPRSVPGTGPPCHDPLARSDGRLGTRPSAPR
jgi:aspartokinase-like uncharacterized kinase